MLSFQRWRGWLCAVILVCACSGTTAHPVDRGVIDRSDAAASADSAMGDACSVTALADPRVATTYYVAINEPGADNMACDGSAPTDTGGGHCPFKDFSSAHTRDLLNGARGVRVNVRDGTYVVHGWSGITIHGLGESEDERVVLSAYQDEHPVLDVAAPDGAPCMTSDPTQNPLCVRQVLDVSGTYTLVQGLTIQNGLGYHVAIVGGAHHIFRCNTLHETVAFPMRSDMLKLAGDGNDLQVLHNDFSRFRSQAIDITQVSDVLVEDNDFHDPIDADAGATGTKFGAHRITIHNNRIHDFGSDPKMHAFSLGGTGSGHPDDHEAYEVHVVGNHVSNIAGLVAQVVSCVGCSFEDNVIDGAGAGILVAASGTAQPDCTAAADGCGPNMGTRIIGNRFRNLDGAGDPQQADTFVGIDAGEDVGAVVDKNTYCAITAPRFLWQGRPLTLEAWRTTTQLDATSVAPSSGEPDCSW